MKLKHKLNELGKELVFIHADKATNDIVVIWHKFYFEILQKETD